MRASLRSSFPRKRESTSCSRRSRPTHNVRDNLLSRGWREKAARGILLDLKKIAATLAARGGGAAAGDVPRRLALAGARENAWSGSARGLSRPTIGRSSYRFSGGPSRSSTSAYASPCSSAARRRTRGGDRRLRAHLPAPHRALQEGGHATKQPEISWLERATTAFKRSGPSAVCGLVGSEGQYHPTIRRENVLLNRVLKERL
jgi:hypothetical protein